MAQREAKLFIEKVTALMLLKLKKNSYTLKFKGSQNNNKKQFFYYYLKQRRL